MKKGYSGANITIMDEYVTKTGKGMVNQAQLCLMLYPVTPKAYSWYQNEHEDGEGNREEFYRMEKLEEPENCRAENLLVQMFEILKATVWSRNIIPTGAGWIPHLTDFVKGLDIEFKPLEPLFDKMAIPHHDCSLIHGDPTLSNVMFRQGRTYDQLCIVDPIQPTGKIPSFWTVDVGKLLQSAIGWEYQTLGWRYDRSECVSAVLNMVGTHHSGGTVGANEALRREVWFWCMVHCLRILPYVDKDSEEALWARTRAKVIYDYIKNKEEISCAMPSILMAL